MAKLSVIVPVYNTSNSVEKCLLSLCNQTLEDIKIIVVNDGSVDDTETVCLKMKELYPQKIEYYYKENEGVATARNFGVSKVTTEFFGFLDSDDYVDEKMMEVMLNQIEADQSNICMCDFYWVYPDRKVIAHDGVYRDSKEVLSQMFATLWNKVYKTAWIKESGIHFPDGLHYEDASFLYRLVPTMGKVSYVDKPFVYYIQREGSITHTYNINIQDMISVFVGIKEYYQENGYLNEYHEELEYLFIRFFLGNSYLRAVKIKDKTVKKETLNQAWHFLNESFPNWKKNAYIKKPGKKNLYFRWINKPLYKFNATLFYWLYRFKLMK